MGDSKLFVVRPASKQARTDYKDTFRVYLSPSSLLQVKVRVGELCTLQQPDSASAGAKTAIAWTAAEKIHDNIVQASKQLQELYGLKLGDKVAVSPAPAPLADIESLRLEETSQPAAPASASAAAAAKVTARELTEEERPHWEWALEHPLSKCEVVALGLVFDVELKGVLRRFKVVHIDPESGASTANSVFRFTDRSRILIAAAGTASADAGAGSQSNALQVFAQGLGAIDAQLATINERLQDFNVESQHGISMPAFYTSSGGILIYGAKGTGKTALLSKIEEAGWRRTFAITSAILNRASNGADGAAVLRKIFSDALKYQPSLIKIDQLEFVAPKRGSGSSEAATISPTLCEGLDSLKDSRVLVVACTRHPNDVDDSLRAPHRLGIEIELPVPTSKGRLEILRALRGSASQPKQSILKTTAEKTHGYVGADLLSLLQLSCRKAKARMLSPRPEAQPKSRVPRALQPPPSPLRMPRFYMSGEVEYDQFDHYGDKRRRRQTLEEVEEEEQKRREATRLRAEQAELLKNPGAAREKLKLSLEEDQRQEERIEWGKEDEGEEGEEVEEEEDEEDKEEEEEGRDEPGKPRPLKITEEDVSLALKEIRPTAMQEVFLETPSVRWADIGGQRHIKNTLRKAVQRPLKNPERMKDLNISGKKGILLYGPPGCSKTMMVKALATEAGLNFLAVKGAEVLSMYVGESERALREIFRKARSASPSIIFFDEIDAIAARRAAGSHSGVNVLTTLLNEMDGIEELKNVLVVAATNKPETLDPALMRPGRLDSILYIGLPDIEARKEIFENWIRRSTVNEGVDALILASLTNGHSGAELVNICETAAELCMDEEEETGVAALEIQHAHFNAALNMVPKRIQPEDIREYEQWSKNFTSRQQLGIHP